MCNFTCFFPSSFFPCWPAALLTSEFSVYGGKSWMFRSKREEAKISTPFKVGQIQTRCFCCHRSSTSWLIFCLFLPQLVTQRASKTWTWTLCVCVFSVSSSGMTAGRTASAQWCPTPSTTRVRHFIQRLKLVASVSPDSQACFLLCPPQRPPRHHSWRSAVWTSTEVPVRERRRSSCSVTKCRKVSFIRGHN